jgi:hypothetical protein
MCCFWRFGGLCHNTDPKCGLAIPAHQQSKQPLIGPLFEGYWNMFFPKQFCPILRLTWTYSPHSGHFEDREAEQRLGISHGKNSTAYRQAADTLSDGYVWESRYF